MVAIVSDSGAGKSSLAMAGLVPAFRGGALASTSVQEPTSQTRHVVVMRPGTDPMRGLQDGVNTAAIALGLDGETRAELRRRVTAKDIGELIHAIECDLPFEDIDTLLVVDQAKELVTQCDEAGCGAFLDLLLALSAQGEGVRVLLTVRADYFNLFSTHAAFFARLTDTPERTQLRLPRLSDEGIRQVVSDPLRLAGHDNDGDALIQTVQRDTMGRPGDTAPIQFALWSAWRGRTGGGSLTQAYTAAGGVFGAMGAEAGRVRGALSKQEQALLLPLFVRLVRPSETGGATGRVAPLDELDEDRKHLAGRLAEETSARLLQISDASVQIAHEALIRQWPWLQSELEEVGDDIRLLHRLTEAASVWEAEEQSDARLAQDAALSDFEALLSRRSGWASASELAFVGASVTRREAAAAAEGPHASANWRHRRRSLQGRRNAATSLPAHLLSASPCSPSRDGSGRRQEPSGMRPTPSG